MGLRPPAKCTAVTGGHYDVYQGGESFNDVIQVELEFLHRHAKKARLNVSFDPTDQPSYVTKRAIAVHRSPNTSKHNMITKKAYFSWIMTIIHDIRRKSWSWGSG